MKFPRAILLMLTGLAGGVGARLAFTAPAESAPRHSSGAGGNSARSAGEFAVKEEKSGPRPEETAVLAARGGSRLRLLMAWLPGAGEEELLRMADTLAGPDAPENLSIRLLMARWAEVNPAAMLAWAGAQKNDDYGTGFFVNNAIECWARVDFDKAWAIACSELPQTRSSALLGLTVADPGKCLAILRADPSLVDGTTGNASYTVPMAKVIARLAARDPAGTAALLAVGPPSRLRRYAGDVALKWAKSDPASAVAWMRGLDPGVRQASLEAAAKWIAAHAPEELPALLASLPAGRTRSMAEAEGFSRLASANPAAALRQLEAMPGSPSRQLYRGLLMKELLRSGDDAGALALAGQLGWEMPDEACPDAILTVTPNGRSSSRGSDDLGNTISRAFRELMGHIVARDPQQAAALLAKSNAGSSELLEGVALTNHAALAAALLARGDSLASSRCSEVVNLWSGSDPAAAAAWMAANVRSAEVRATMLPGVLANWSADPPAMLQWAATMDAETVRAAWGQLASSNPEYTTAHLDEFAAVADASAYEVLLRGNHSSDDAGRILQILPENMDVDIARPMVAWLTEKPEEATKWVRDLPPGVQRTSATEEIVAHLNAEEDHEGAFAWAATLPEEKRADVLPDTLTNWNTADPAAAQAAIRASALPPEEQQSLLERLKEPPPP